MTTHQTEAHPTKLPSQAHQIMVKLAHQIMVKLITKGQFCLIRKISVSSVTNIWIFFERLRTFVLSVDQNTLV